MKLTPLEEAMCEQHMDDCETCPLNLTKEMGYPECYATVDGRGLGLKRYKCKMVYGLPAIADYLGITFYQVLHRRDALQIPCRKRNRNYYALSVELDKWKGEQHD